MPTRLILALSLAALLAAGCGSSEAARANRQGNEAFARQEYETALAAYESALEAAPARPQALYNLGNTQYRLQEGELAQRTLESAATVAQALDAGGTARSDEGALPLDSQAWYNLGNVRFAAQDYAGAVEAYKQALRRAPSDMDAKVNLELALRKLQENEEQQEDENEGSPTPTATPSPTPSPTPGEPPPNEGEATPTATPTLAPSATPNATETPAAGDQPPPSPTTPPTPTSAPPTATPQSSTANAEPGATPTQLPSTTSPGPLTVEQAQRILEAAAGGTQTLQEALMQQLPPADESVEKDW